MEFKGRDKQLESIRHEFNGIIEKSFEGFHVSGSSIHASPDLDGWANFQARFYQNNSSLVGTKYQLDSDIKIVHFTSLPVL